MLVCFRGQRNCFGNTPAGLPAQPPLLPRQAFVLNGDSLNFLKVSLYSKAFLECLLYASLCARSLKHLHRREDVCPLGLTSGTCSGQTAKE